MLKIIGGEAKGRSLRSVPSPHLRPILARVKKSLFDILRPRIPGARFLDLYAGTGAVGLEALSRGATFAAFVENDLRSFSILKENIAKLGFDDRARAYRLGATGDLNTIPGPFDLVFMGPPYKDDTKTPLELVEPTITNVLASGLVGENGLVVAQHHKKENPQAPKGWVLTRREKYGDTLLSFFSAEKTTS